MKRCYGCMELYEEEKTVCPHCGYVENTPVLETMCLPQGYQLINRYIVGKVIGIGGFGVTYIAWDNVLEKRVAIKEYLPGEFSTRLEGQTRVTVFSGEKAEQYKAGRVRFFEEAKMLMKFKSADGIVQFFNCFEENGTVYIVMEYLEGETVKERLKREKTISVVEALNIMMPIVDAIEKIHKENIIHRDISPDNIILTKDGKVKLIDFGASKFATTTYSKSLSVLIKPGFVAEEQYSGRNLGPWSDVYSIAATLYNMVTGIVPKDSMERAIKDDLKSPAKLGVNIPKNIDIAIMNALNREYTDRTQDCAAFKEEINDLRVKRRFIKQKKIDIGRWPLWAKITASVSGAAVAAVLVLLFTGVISFSFIGSIASMLGNGEVEVPEVIARSMKEAEKKVEKAGLVIQYTEYIEDENIPKDCIYSQTPGANERVKEGSAVYVVVSCGVEAKLMINAVGYPLEKVQSQIEDLGARVQVCYVDSNGMQGTVVRQLLNNEELEEGEELKEGMVVTLEVSNGNAVDMEGETTVPDFTGKTYKEALELAETSHIMLCIGSDELNAQYKKGTMVRQDINAGQTVVAGQVVTLVRSAGDKITVPDFKLKAVDEIEELAKKCQITYRLEYVDSDSVLKDRVIEQSVKAGEKIAYTEELVLKISKGNDQLVEVTDKPTTKPSDKPTTKPTEAVNATVTPEAKQEQTPVPVENATQIPVQKEEKVKVPDVTKKSLADATKALNSAGLNCEYVYTNFSDTVAEGKVLSQTDKGKSVGKGTTITLQLSKGKAAPKDWTTDDSYVNSKWYTTEKKTQYQVQKRKFEKYETTVSDKNSMNGWELYNTTYTISWGKEEEFASARNTSETYRYVREYDKVTGSHEEWYLARWFNGTYFKDYDAVGYSLEYTSGWYRRSDIWEAAAGRWASNRWHRAGDSEETYPYVHTDTRTVEDKTRYYVYQSGVKVYQYHFRKPVYSAWEEEGWMDSKPEETDTRRVSKERVVYQYTEK